MRPQRKLAEKLEIIDLSDIIEASDFKLSINNKLLHLQEGLDHADKPLMKEREEGEIIVEQLHEEKSKTEPL